jgi:hypothetical protein
MGQFAASGEPTCHLKRDKPFMLSLVRSTFSWIVIVTNIELRHGMVAVSSLKMVAARYTTINFIRMYVRSFRGKMVEIPLCLMHMMLSCAPR